MSEKWTKQDELGFLRNVLKERDARIAELEAETGIIRKWARMWKMVAKLLWRIVNEIGFCDLCRHRLTMYSDEYCGRCGNGDGEKQSFVLDNDLLKGGAGE